VLWPRPLEQTINWAGDPAKGIAGPSELLVPRARFVAWNGTCRGRSAE
jgi:light-regulated signal transduction histidine kinase (bacteriophytochrome)